MRKAILALMILFASVFANAQVNKEDFFGRMYAKYGGAENLSGKYEINMQMMGTTMKIPVMFWKKGAKIRMDMAMSQPGMQKPWEMVMLMDGGKMIQYQKSLNMVMTADLSKLPESALKQMNQNQFFMFDENTINNLKNTGSLDNVDVEERTKAGRNFYLITIRDIDKIGNVMPAPGGQNTGQIFRKALLWICGDSLLPEKMEFYGDADAPGMWIDFQDIKTDTVAESVFNLDIPADAKVMDITEQIKNMAGSVK